MCNTASVSLGVDPTLCRDFRSASVPGFAHNKSYVQVQTLQATRRKEEKETKDSQLTVPVKRQSGTLADIAEVPFPTYLPECAHYDAKKGCMSGT